MTNCLTGGKRRSTKRRSSTRRSSKRRSPKQTSWTRKLQAWRKANKHADGSLPTMKSAMKHCKGKTSRSSKCRKNQGRKASKKRSSKRRSRRSSSKRRTSKKRRSTKRSYKRKSSKRRTSKKRRSTKRKSSKRRTSKKRSSKRRSTKRKSATRKLRKYYPEFVGKKFEVFHRPQPVFAPAPVMQQGSVFGPQTAQAYELRTGKRVDGLVFGPKPAQQPGILESIGNLIMGKQQQQSVSEAITEYQKNQWDKAAQFGEKGIDMYGILGVSNTASEQEIAKAYRKLVLKYHPDKQVNKSDSQKAETAKIMYDVKTAYDVLSDPMTRTYFDKNFVKKNQSVFA
jgi:hypothetical protein